MIFKDISELDKLMTPEQKAKAKADFEKYFPPGTPVVMCLAEDDGEDYLRLVDVESME
jgi:hypothetical protein